MRCLNVALICGLLGAAPASGESLSDTHLMRWAPSGKVPSVTYHPLKRACGQTAKPVHLSGKTHFNPGAAATRSCAKDVSDEARNGMTPTASAAKG
jgi:hypothetical protein